MHATPTPTTRDLPQDTDVVVLSRAQAGDRDARERLAGQFGGLLRTLAAAACRLKCVTPNPDALDDIVQEVYVDILRLRIQPYDSARGSPRQYLLLLTLNALRRLLNNRLITGCAGTLDVALLTAAEDTANSSPAAGTGLSVSTSSRRRDDSVGDPLSLIEAREEMEAMRSGVTAFVAHAPRQIKYAIRRRYFRGEAMKRIATDARVNRSTLTRRLYRYLERGRAALAKYRVA